MRTTRCFVLLAVLAACGRDEPRTETAVVETSTRTVTTTTRSAAPIVPPMESSYVGNVNSHKFHRQTCSYASCMNCTARFATRDEALAAGFRPGGCCDP